VENVPYVFICFSSSDEAAAREVVQRLEEGGINCWISLRDVRPGQNYQESIIHALDEAKALVFLFSAASAASGETKKELSVAGSLNMPVFPLRLSPVTPTGALRYELATRQWIDVFLDRDEGFRKLIEAIRRIMEGGEVTTYVPMAAAAPVITEIAPKQRVAAAPAPIIAASSPEFEAIRALLARHVGPIAKIIMQKAATEARTPDDLCERLASHVSLPSERAAFLREARSRLAGKSSG
jgi:hypothetical protein